MSDMHLSFRRHPATFGGRNAREVDVERAWGAAVERTVEARPDLITIAGDVFDHPRPTTHALHAFQTGIARLLGELPHAVIVIIPGNHEGTRTVEALTPVILAEVLDQRVVVVQEPRRVHVPMFRTGERCAISCFPFGVLHAGATYDVAPDPDADVNVLLLHAAVRTSAETVHFPTGYAGPEAFDVGPAADQFDAILCGDYHTFQRLHPTRIALYSGSLERVSSNIWAEPEMKGVVHYDTETGALALLPVPTRPMFSYGSLAQVFALAFEFTPRGMEEVSASELNRALEYLMAVPEHAGAMVRLVVEDFPREERGLINQRAVRALRELCLHFDLVVRPRETTLRQVEARREALSSSLDEECAAFMADEPEAVRSLALEHMAKAGAA